MTDNVDAESYEKNVKIFVRIYPLEKPCEFCARIDTDLKRIYVRSLQELKPNRISTTKEASYWCFETDGIFHASSQEEVYRVTSADLVQKVLGGVSCVLMGYGQIGSGKSFTIGGLGNNWEHRGLVTRLLSDMFAEMVNRKKVNDIEYRLSFVELRGKEVKDLLIPEMENRMKITINERDAFKDISMVNVTTQEETLKHIFEGEARRAMVKGSTYPASHLATAVITFHVSNARLNVTAAKAHQIHVVEMAGTGTVGKSNSLKVASDIGAANIARSQLEQYFSCLGNTTSSAHIVLRSSNLLKLLGTAISVTSIIRFISHVRITREDLDVTLSTLKLGAKIARSAPVKTIQDIRPRSDLVVQNLRDEVNSLKRELLINDMLLRQEATLNISRSRAEQIDRSIVNFLNGTITDFTLFSVSQAQVLLQSIKDLYNRLTAKEIEVEKLREMYENAGNNLEQTGRGLEVRSSKISGPLINGSLNNNRKRTRTSSHLLNTLEEEVTKEQVGSLDKSMMGVTFGPEFGQDRPDRVDEYGRSKIFEPRSAVNNQKFAMMKRTFERFLKQEKAHSNTKEELDQNEKFLDSLCPTFSNKIDKYFEAKRNLDNIRNELKKQQEIRRIVGVPKYDEDETENYRKIQRSMAKDITCYQNTVVDLEEQVLLARKEIRDLLDRRLTMRSGLETAFREYCDKLDPPVPWNAESMKLLLDSPNRDSLEKLRKTFDQLQWTMRRRIKEKQKSKKVRFDYGR